MPPSIRRSDDRVSDRVGCRISRRSSLVLCPTLRPCGFAGCASLVLRRTLRPCGVASCARRWGRLCREIRSLRRLVRSVAGIDDQSGLVTWLLYWRRSPDWRRSVVSNELRHQLGTLGVEAAGLGARAGEGLRLRSTSKVVVNLFYVAIEVPGFTRRDLTP